jgi:ankyrin repeat protein
VAAGTTDAYGITPLHFAAQGRRRATAELLVARGAPLDARDGLNGDTPFDWTRRDPAGRTC